MGYPFVTDGFSNLYKMSDNYISITAYLPLWVNLDKIMHMHWNFDASSAQTIRVSALLKHNKMD